MKTPKNILRRIERSIIGPLDDELCWESGFSVGTTGYPTVGKEYPQLGTHLVHRVVWEAHNAEPIPPGMHVLHTCDNPRCVNPKHLFLGTNEDNIQDKCRKGRQKGISSERALERSHQRKRNSLGQFL